MDDGVPGSVVIKLDARTRKWAIAGVLIFLASGVAICVVAVGGLAHQTVTQRVFVTLIGLALIAVAVFGVRGLRITPRTLTLDSTGFAGRRKSGGFTVRWAGISHIVISREKRRMGRNRFWFYELAWRAEEPLPEVAYLLHSDGVYRYALGGLGRGKRLYAAFERFGPQSVRVVR